MKRQPETATILTITAKSNRIEDLINLYNQAFGARSNKRQNWQASKISIFVGKLAVIGGRFNTIPTKILWEINKKNGGFIFNFPCKIRVKIILIWRTP